MRKSLRHQFGHFLRQQRGDRTLRDFGKVTGLSSSTLQRLEIGEQNVTLDTLEKVLKRMGVTVGDVFKD